MLRPLTRHASLAEGLDSDTEPCARRLNYFYGAKVDDTVIVGPEHMLHKVMLNMEHGELVKRWKVNRQNSAQGLMMGIELAIILTPTSLIRLMSLRGTPGYLMDSPKTNDHILVKSCKGFSMCFAALTPSVQAARAVASRYHTCLEDVPIAIITTKVCRHEKCVRLFRREAYGLITKDFAEHCPMRGGTRPLSGTPPRREAFATPVSGQCWECRGVRGSHLDAQCSGYAGAA